jgi:long-chain fatty acid transport protein
MGGVGIAVSHGSESAYANPAMIKDVKDSEFSGYVTMFQPNVNFKSDAHPQLTSENTAYSKSDADSSFIPGFAYVQRNNENIVWGISLAGTAGMGTDYKKAKANSGAFGMQTELGIAKLSVPVAYTSGDLTVAFAPILQYSTLEINYQTPAGASNNKKDSSVGLGMTAGLVYDMGDLTLGAMYKSKIEANYKNNISSAMRDFGVQSVTSGDQLDQPAEIGVGAAYTMGNSTFGLDLMQVQWSDATGYKDFNWEDQNIVKVGYQYATPTWALRAGYNHGKSPVQELTGANTSFDNSAINYFNLSGFPAIVEEHYTLGGDYAVSKALKFSLAAVYSPEVSNSFNTTAMTYGLAYGGALQQGATQAQAQAGAGQAASAGSTAQVTHSQTAITLGAAYSF